MRLVGQIYRHLMSDDGVLPEDWFARQIARLDATEGDVATLSGRLTQIRTWTYAAHRPGWLADQTHWQEETRAIEDRLSDALHERLTQRFVDRRTAVLMRHLREDDISDFALDDSGAVSIGGEFVGKLTGFRFEADPAAEGVHGKTLRAATAKSLQGEFFARARQICDAAPAAIHLSEHGQFWWDGAAVGKLVPGANALEPRVVVMADETVSNDVRASVEARLTAWLAQKIDERLEPLLALKRASEAKPGLPQALSAQSRGLAFQLWQGFGSLDRSQATMPANERAAQRELRAFGIKFGRRVIFMPRLLKPDAASLLALFWSIAHKLENVPQLPPPGRTSFDVDAALPSGFLSAGGFRIAGPRAIRLDMLERIDDELSTAAAHGLDAEAIQPKLLSLLGCDRETLEPVLAAMGWRRVAVNAAESASASVWRQQAASRRRRPPRDRAPLKPEADSPFAGLSRLLTTD